MYYRYEIKFPNGKKMGLFTGINDYLLHLYKKDKKKALILDNLLQMLDNELTLPPNSVFKDNPKGLSWFTYLGHEKYVYYIDKLSHFFSQQKEIKMVQVKTKKIKHVSYRDTDQVIGIQ